MEKFIDKIGTKYVVQKIKETVRVVPRSELDEVQVSQMICLPVTGYQDEYLTLSALEDGLIEIVVPTAVDQNYATSLSYSKDKSSWTEPIPITNTYQSIKIPVSAGDDVYLKGVAQQWTNTGSSLYSTSINSTANFIVSGNAMSLLYADDFRGKVTLPDGSKYNFRSLFQNNTHLINAENLVLPATTLNSSCYQNMFYGCTSLTTAPELPATTLASYCYSSMFRGCTSLTKTPKLPAETLASYCYYYMFYGCTSLTTAPALPATVLVEQCYYSMFNGCTSLNNITMLTTDISAYNCLSDWVNGVSSTGTFTKAASMASLPTGVNGIPSGWTVTNK